MIEYLKSYPALEVSLDNRHKLVSKIVDRQLDDIPRNDVLIQVEYASFSHYDSLILQKHHSQSPSVPIVPGIDVTGIVARSNTSKFSVGEPVTINGYGLGDVTDGGIANYVSVPANWVTSLPPNLSTRECISYGTPGLNVVLSVAQLTYAEITGNILVTNAHSSTGCLLVSLLSKLGNNVHAITNAKGHVNFLEKLGASQVIVSKDDDSNVTQLTQLVGDGYYHAIIDVQGITVNRYLNLLSDFGCLIIVNSFPSVQQNVDYSVIARKNLNMFGVNSINAPQELKQNIWDKFVKTWKFTSLDWIITEITMPEAEPFIQSIVEDNFKGHLIIKMGESNS